jgi:malate dehydrogenase (oxaloacetate-decarboxylating)(NADP+)
VKKDNVLLLDSKGVIHDGRDNLTSQKQEFAAKTHLRDLGEALVDADVFIGLSVGGLLKPESLASMARDPIVLAMANPNPEIEYDKALETRPDVIMATGRSDYPNQVNNVLGFPFIFRGALDVRATEINDSMIEAAVHALAELAREDVPDSVLKAYGAERLEFGREYLIPTPFDHRVLLRLAPAVAQAAMESGVARQPIADLDDYRRHLDSLISRRRQVMHSVLDQAKSRPMRVVFPEGEHEKVLRAAKILVDEGIAKPILLARRAVIASRLEELGLDEESVVIVHNESSELFDGYAQALSDRRRRFGVTLEDARKLLRSRNYFGSMMVAIGDADGLISGLTQEYPDTIRPALQTIDTAPGVNRVSGAYVLILEDRVLFLADTTVNIDPDPDELAEIAVLTAAFARRFGIEPRVAMLSFSNFGSNSHPAARKVRRAVEIAKELEPTLEIDGEMQADTAVLESILHERYPWSDLKSSANVLVFPELQSANIAYKLIWRLAEAEAIGPVLLGMAKPVHVLQRGVEVADIVNMTALCVVDAQELDRDR